MDLMEKVTGHCEISGQEVEIVMVKLKKPKQKMATLTPLRCQNSAACSRSVFCRFVNPLTTRIPVNLEKSTGDAEAS